ncbi:PREDICTED: nucleolar protein of 40 kDa-like [Vollenhovia emeryi]|uniref:nucleolar protein of 40 kDa-like n=1 Tax=Vollenhovia emeryi TaxID=411798 RepID=UPI0005F3DEF0|nr:PREDICTED: nucleolar protein of 40 kDa-like [Vollenhovia emeryi]
MAARVELLEARPLVCFRCLERGHVRQQCRSKVDRSAACYRCGSEGHQAQDCILEPSCPVCKAKDLPDRHKAGGTACPSPSKRETKKRRQEGNPQATEKTRTTREKSSQKEKETSKDVEESRDVNMNESCETIPVDTEMDAPQDEQGPTGDRSTEVSGLEEAGKPTPSRR